MPPLGPGVCFGGPVAFAFRAKALQAFQAPVASALRRLTAAQRHLQVAEASPHLGQRVPGSHLRASLSCLRNFIKLLLESPKQRFRFRGVRKVSHLEPASFRFCTAWVARRHMGTLFRRMQAQGCFRPVGFVFSTRFRKPKTSGNESRQAS